jgi:signal transduction histidine kinase
MDQFARLEAAERAAQDRTSDPLPGAPRAALPGDVGGIGPSDDFRSLDLVAVVRRAVDSQRSYLVDGPTLQVDLPSEPRLMMGEPIQLEMVVVQLIRNATAAASPQGEVGGPGGTSETSGSIRVSLCDSGDALELSVEDDGPGIEEETVDEVFDPFVAAGRSPRSRGLGLSVVHRVVKDHGGELRLESAPGRGTRVTVLLPGQGGDSA